MEKEKARDRVAGVVVLYNPNGRIAGNIGSYVHDLGRLYVVDNSEGPIPSALEAFLVGVRNAEYIRFGENVGIARALNEGAVRAMNDGFEWLLTMDQDSSAPPGMVARLHEFAAAGHKEGVAVVAPMTSDDHRAQTAGGQIEWEYAMTVYSSGNLVDLAAVRAVGGWRNEMFIDSVDHAFNLDLQKKGYKIVRLNRLVLDHSLGEGRTIRLPGRGRVTLTTGHDHIRRYYITRNRLYVSSLFADSFPEFVRSQKVLERKELLKIVLFEKDKIRKLKSVCRGRRDFHRNLFGPMPHKK